MKKILGLLMLCGLGLAQAPPPSVYAISEQALPSVGAVTANYTGVAGATQYCYFVVARFAIGNAQPSPITCLTKIATSGSIAVSWAAPQIPNAPQYVLTYDVVRLPTSNFPSSGTCANCLLASATSGLTATDTSAALSSYTYTSYAVSTKNYLIDNTSTDRNILYQVTPSSGGKEQVVARSGPTLPLYCNPGDSFQVINSNNYACLSSGGFGFWVGANSSFTPAAFGAKCDNITNDTDAFNRMANAALANGGGRLFLPAANCVVFPLSTTQFLVNGSNLQWVGSGFRTVIKVGNNAGSYQCMFGTAGQTVAANTFEDFQINMNSPNNPLISTGDLATNPRYMLSQNSASSHLLIQNMIVFGINDVNAVQAAGFRTTITNSVFKQIGGGTIYHDHSTLYINGDSAVISNNQFSSNSLGAAGAVTAIETHGSAHTITGNVISGMQFGMNITGVALTTSTGITVSGNVVTNCYGGIDLWSFTLGAHTTGAGLDDITVSGNTVYSSWLSYTTDAQTGLAVIGNMFGIILNGGSGLLVPLVARTVNITGNTVEFDLSTSTSDIIDNSSQGIGFLESQNSAFDVYDGLTIQNNTIRNAPLAGVRVSAMGTSLHIANNTIINPGSILNVTPSASLHTGVLVTSVGGVQKDTRVYLNRISDDQSTSRVAYCINFVTTNTLDLIALTNTCTILGTTITSVVKPFEANNNTQIPLITGTVYAPSMATAAVVPASKMNQGSTIYDAFAGRNYWVNAAGTGWIAPPALVQVAGATIAQGINLIKANALTGDYQICMSGWITTAATSGTINLLIQTTAVGTIGPTINVGTIDVSSLTGSGGGCTFLHSTGGTNLIYSTTFTSVVGTPTYSFDIIATQLR